MYHQSMALLFAVMMVLTKFALANQASPVILDKYSSKDESVIEGHNLTLHCRATGNPKPTISWIREPEYLPVQGKKIDDENLYFYNISRHDTGFYLCVASNNITPTVSKRMSVEVNFGPTIYASDVVKTTTKHSRVMISWDIFSYPTGKLYLVKDNKNFISEGCGNNVCPNTTDDKCNAFRKIYDFNIEEISLFHCRLTFFILNAIEQDTANYFCRTDNFYGHDGVNISIIVTEAPTTTTEALTKPTSTTTSTSTTTTEEQNTTEYIDLEQSQGNPASRMVNISIVSLAAVLAVAKVIKIYNN